VTHLRKMMLEELQGRKSRRLCLAGLRIWWFDPIAEASDLPKHLPSAELLRSFGDRGAAFFVTDSLVQDQPDQSTLSMGDGPDGFANLRRHAGTTIIRTYSSTFARGCRHGELVVTD
jgi:hypothetical protein